MWMVCSLVTTVVMAARPCFSSLPFFVGAILLGQGWKGSCFFFF